MGGAPLHPSTGITDEQAMWRVRMEDDPAAFALLVQRWEKPIQALCTRMTGDLHQGEDLAQEAFTRLFTRRKEYQFAARFSTYLWRVALNLCYDELRRRKRRAERSLEECAEGLVHPEAPSLEPAPDEHLAGREQAELVRQALLRLPEGHRAVLVLRHYENLKFREIAEVLEIPEGTVKSRLAEALSRLARTLKPRLAEAPSAWPGSPRIQTQSNAL